MAYFFKDVDRDILEIKRVLSKFSGKVPENGIDLN